MITQAQNSSTNFSLIKDKKIMVKEQKTLQFSQNKNVHKLKNYVTTIVRALVNNY